MANKKDFFVSLDDTYKSEVVLGDGKKRKIEGKGTIAVITTDDCKKLIAEVNYVPTLSRNLFSVGQLLQKGYVVRFEDHVCYITDIKTDEIIAEAKINENNVFILTMNPFQLSSKEHVKTCIDDSENTLGHRRMGHLNWDSLFLLPKLTDGIRLKPQNQNSMCDVCNRGKSHRSSFPKSSNTRAKGILELLHMDLWGPSSTITLGGMSYYFLIVDDHNRFMWLYLLKNKSETLQVFKDFVKQIESKTEKNVKIIRSDRGGEFMSHSFKSFYNEKGIKHELTAPASPQQNGAVERRNRTIVEMVRTMLLQAKSDKKLWGEAAATAVYILNRSPTKAIRNNTPFEMFWDKRPDLSHLKIFGYIAYAHKVNEKKDKLDETSLKCIFLGYSEDSKAYRLLNTENQKLIISRDVKVDENSYWSSSKNEKTKEQLVDDSTLVFTPALYKDQSPDQLSPNDPVDIDIPNKDTDDEEAHHTKFRSIEDIYSRAPRVNYVLSALTPANFREAVKEEVWKKAIVEEMNTVNKNHTWTLVSRPEGRTIIGLK